MSLAKTELVNALADVRRAYRLLHAYHRRVNDLFYVAHEFLVKQGMEFDSWGPLNVWSLPRKSTPFFRPETWAWDLTPAYQVECVWRRSNNKMHHKVHIHAIADTGYDASTNGEPDPSKFDSPTECRSEIRVDLHRTPANAPNWTAAWTELSKKATRKDGAIHHVMIDNNSYAYRYFDIDLASLGDEHAVRGRILQPLDEWLATV